MSTFPIAAPVLQSYEFFCGNVFETEEEMNLHRTMKMKIMIISVIKCEKCTEKRKPKI